MSEINHRDFEVAYWYGYPHAKRPSTRGFPKTETGVKDKSMGAAGALRVVNSGWASKIVCTHRPSGKVLWTALREKVPGLHIYQARLVKGEYDFNVKG